MSQTSRTVPLVLSALALLLTLAALPAAAQKSGENPAPDPEAATSEPRVEAQPDPRAHWPEGHGDRPLRAAFLVVDGVYNTELTAPWDVLEHTRVHRGDLPPVEVFTVSPDGKPVTTAEGLVIVADHSFADHPPVDLLVVPSAEGSRDADLKDEALIGWVKKVGGEADYVMSLCWGAFVLGEAGLLDGRAATTFPADYDTFAERFPGTEVKVNVSFVHDGKALTSQGGVRSFDVALYLADLLYGEDAARGIGGGLLIPWPPDLETGPDFAVVPAPADTPQPADPASP